MSTSTQNWTPTARELPPVGEAVETMNSSGEVQVLIRHGHLWFHKDMRMYVYYVPAYWRNP